jgi:spore coat polysaccharide biosynthesis predicted glycosyltransferase SpsG
VTPAAPTEPIALRCFVSAGARHGLGHATRVLEIAREALARGWRIAVALRGDEEARALFHERLPGVALEEWCSADLAARPARHQLFDTRESIADELARGRAIGAHRVVLDRVDHLDDADLTVLPHLHGNAPAHPRLVHGGRWCPIPAPLRALAARAEAPVRRGVLVTLGGADPHDLTSRVLEPLAAAIARAPDDPGPVHVLLGRCFGDRPWLVRRIEALGFRSHIDLCHPTLGVLMQHSAFAVCGFGTTVYELAWLGTPALYLAHHPGDARAAETLERVGVGAFGGAAPSLDEAALADRLAKTVLDPTWRAGRAARGRALLGDGRGARRLVEAMQAARPAAANPGGMP